ncbi:MAG: EF-hand domain-containing protein [Pseudomonadota bacterium]
MTRQLVLASVTSVLMAVGLPAAAQTSAPTGATTAADAATAAEARAAARAERRKGRRAGRDMRRMGRLFALADADEDGRLTQQEIDMAEAARFAEMDRNGDGAVDVDELVAFAERQRAARRIARLDLNEDGVLQPNELAHQPIALDAFDLDGDGAVTRTELRRAHRDGRKRRD